MKNKDMKILFWGGIKENTGPENINKGIVHNLSDAFVYVTTEKTFGNILKLVKTLLMADAVVVSGVGRMNCVLVGVARMLGKPSVYLMHGCADFEYRINNRPPNPKGLKWEAYLLDRATLLLPVSRRFMLWVHQRYPQYQNKTAFLYNGVDKELFEQKPNEQKSRDIAVAGGLRPQKMNLAVAEAVEAMDERIILDIYGGTSEDYTDGGKIRMHGNLPHEQFLRNLSETQLFVLNSAFEPFSIAALEALACGCSLLVSEAAGVADLLALEEEDTTHDPADVEELRRKMEYLLEHPNHRRLREQFDADRWSFEKMVMGLENYCRELVQR